MVLLVVGLDHYNGDCLTDSLRLRFVEYCLFLVFGIDPAQTASSSGPRITRLCHHLGGSDPFVFAIRC